MKNASLDSRRTSDRRASFSEHRRDRTALSALGVGLLLVVLLAVSGCSAEADPGGAATGGSSTSARPPTPTLTPSPAKPVPTKTYKPASAAGPAQNVPVPVLPAAAKEFSKKGLEEFARYWYSTLSYAYETGSMKSMMAVTDPGCVTCASVKKTVDHWYGSGGWIVGGQIELSAVQSTFIRTPDGTYQAILMVKQRPVSFYTSGGNLDQALSAKPARGDILVARFIDARWQTVTAEHLSKD